VSASESLSWATTESGAAAGTNLSGDLVTFEQQIVPVQRGVLRWLFLEHVGQPSYNFLNLGMSQSSVEEVEHVVSDSVSYLLEHQRRACLAFPVGDLGVSPIQVGADTGQGVLTNYSDASAIPSRKCSASLTGKTSSTPWFLWNPAFPRYRRRGQTVTHDRGVVLAINLIRAPHSRNYRIRPIIPGNSTRCEPSSASQSASGQITTNSLAIQC